MVKKKPKSQKELPGMPELDAAGKMALRLQDANNSIAEALEERDEIEKQLVEILASTSRERVHVGDRMFVLTHVKAKDKIKVVKVRKKQKGDEN